MMIRTTATLLGIIILMKFIISLADVTETGIRETAAGAFWTGQYPNLFTDLLGISTDVVNAKIDHYWEQLFYGDDENERVYYPTNQDMAYIKDINNNDVRSEGMSYGMMIAVQLDKKESFDRIWKWAKTFMQHREGHRKGFFAWKMSTNGAIQDSNSASDGEEWFVMALFFAAARWGNGDGIFNYQREAQNILNAMLSKTDNSNSRLVVTNMFNKTEKQVVFVPVGNADDFTDPSYHVPHFYELWGRWAEKNRDFWLDAAETSRRFLKKVAHPVTGLTPDYAHFDGTPIDAPWGGGHDAFRFDAWRVVMNVAVDYLWFGKDQWAVTQSNRLLDFFTSEGLDSYVNQYSLDGKKLSNDRSGGLMAMNAVAALASTNANKSEYLKALWNLPIPTGRYRYYDGLLQMLAMIQVSGNFKIFHLNK
jgi:oligosaccharide reducing-end xylanase